MKSNLLTRAASFAGLGIAVFVVLALGWYSMAQLSTDVLAAWALLATIGLPVVAVIARRMGLAEARGALAGLQQGGKTAVAMSRAVTGIRVQAAQAVREPVHQPATIALPMPPVSVGRHGALPDEIIDL